MIYSINILLLSAFFFLGNSNLVAQKSKKTKDYITELRLTYEPKLIFSNQINQNLSTIPFSESINDSIQFYSDSVKNIYKKKEIYIKGYSVLAYNGNNREKGLQLRSKILRYFPEAKVKLEYISPNFKLKVGPFENKLGAVRIKEGLLRKGLSSVLIVPDKIRIIKK